MHGYKVVVDENLNPGKYGFRLVHETQPAHFFCSDEQPVIREWMKALMKATIDRDYSSKYYDGIFWVYHLKLCLRTRRIFVQCTYHSTKYCSNHESRTSTTVAHCAGCNTESPPTRESEPAFKSGCQDSHGSTWGKRKR